MKISVFKKFLCFIFEKKRLRQEEIMRAKMSGKPFGIFRKKYYFSYDEYFPIFEVLEDTEKKRAIYLNAKGWRKGLIKKELEELMSLYSKGIKIYEKKLVSEEKL